MITITSNSNK